MSREVSVNEDAVAAGVAELRDRFPRTQDLYREVCVMLFFRYGITPTANKLYQLVRKGSMSAPTEALNQFWKTLRERSRVTVDHADLPDELRTAAGDMVAVLWTSAQTISLNNLSSLRTEAIATVDAARASEARTREAHMAVLEELERVRTQVHKYEEDARQFRQDLASATAAKACLDGQLEELRRQVIDLHTQMNRERDEHAAEREKLADRTQLAEQRYADMEKRALLEIDRERTASAKLQKALEAERVAHNFSSERLRADHNAAQGLIGQLREQIGLLQAAASALKEERAREQAELQTLRGQLEVAIRQAAAESAVADQFRQESDRVRGSRNDPYLTRVSRTRQGAAKFRSTAVQRLNNKKHKL